MALKSLAVNQKEMEVGKQSSPSYPYASFEEKQLPELKGSDVGDEIMILVKAKITSKNEYKNGDINYGFDLLEGDIVEEINNDEGDKE